MRDFLESTLPVADKTDLDQLTQIGVCYLALRDESTAIHWLQMAAEQGGREAMYFLGKACRGNWESSYWYERGAELGDIDCMLGYISLYEQSKDSQYAANAARFYLQAIRRGEVELAGGYAKHIIRTRNHSMFEDFESFIFRCSNTKRQEIAVQALKTGKREIVQLATRWLQPEIDSKNGEILGQLGSAYNGLKDFENAQMWFRMGAEAGNAFCQMYVELNSG